MFFPLLFMVASSGPGTPAQLPPAPPSVVVVVPAPAPIPTRVVVPAPAVAMPGHFTCTGDSNETADCTVDPPAGDTTNHGDDPAGLLSTTDPAYAADLTAQLCAVKPVFCQ